MNEKTIRETTAETITGFLLLLIFAFFLLGDISGPLTLMVGGVILLGSAYYQMRRGWQVSLVTWVLGAILLVVGLIVRVFLLATLDFNWVAIGIVIVLGYTLFQLRGVFMRKGISETVSESTPPELGQ